MQVSRRIGGGFPERALVVIGSGLDGADARRLAAALACAVLAAGLAAVGPVALKRLIDTLAPAGAAPGASVDLLAPLLLLALYAGALGLARAAGEVRACLFGAADQSISRKLSRRVFSHVMALPLRFHLSRATGGVAQTLENGLQGCRLVMQHLLFTVLPGVIEILVMSIVIGFLLDTVFLMVFAACALALAAVFADGARRVMRASRAVAASRIEANARLADGLLNFEAIKSLAGEAAFARRYDTSLGQTQARWGDFHRARLLNGLQVALVFTAGLGAVLWLAAARVAAGTMSLGDFVLVNAYMLQAVRPLEQLGFGLRDIGQGAAYIGRMADLLGEEPEAGFAPGAGTGAPAAGSAGIVFEKVTFEYLPGRPVFQDLSFEIAPGKVTALAGASGGGKSSIARLLMRFHEPASGRILFGGAPLADYPPAELRRQIAYIPQDISLFNASLAFNIAFPGHDTPGDEIEAAARLASLEELVARLPEGYDTLVGERGLKLSGGEKQRVAIARASLRKARLIIADEATSALDSCTEAGIVAGLAAAGRGVTMLLIAHRLSTIMAADDIIVLDKGCIAERGTHAELLARGGIYAGLWRAQTESG